MVCYPRCPQIILIILCVVRLTYVKELEPEKISANSPTPATKDADEHLWTRSSVSMMLTTKPMEFDQTPVSSKYVTVNTSKLRRNKDKNNKLRKRKRGPAHKSALRKLREDQKKYPYDMPLRGFRRPAILDPGHTTLVRMMEVPIMKWLYRWFYDVYYNKHEYTDIRFSTLSHPGKAYVTVCPAQRRLRFQVETSKEFTVYLMQSPLDNGGEENYDDHLNEIPENTIRISVKDTETRIVVLNKTSVKLPQTTDISEKSRSRSNSDEEHIDFAVYHHDSLKLARNHSYWLWWEQNGLIYMGRDNNPPYVTYLFHVNETKNIYRRFDTVITNKNIINIKTIGFGVSHTGAVAHTDTVSFIIKLEFPHGNKECDCPDNAEKAEMDLAIPAQNNKQELSMGAILEKG